MDDEHGIAGACLGADRVLRGHAHRLFERATDGRVGPGAHEAAEALDVSG
jgi:hypothetical protein